MKIKLKTIEEVKEFVKIICECNVEIFVRQEQLRVNACSVIGLFAMNLFKPMELETDFKQIDANTLDKISKFSA